MPHGLRHNSPPRLILVDDNIRTVGGHFFELASLMLGAAESLGYRCVMATHGSFDQREAVPNTWTLVPTFRVRRMVRHSMGVDGQSVCQRDFQAKPMSTQTLQSLRVRLTDVMMNPPAKRPTTMLSQWSEDLVALLKRLRPTSQDVLLIDTADDFVMLALARAMQQLQIPPMRIDTIFHFALTETKQSDSSERLKQIGNQLHRCLAALEPHAVHLHATTPALAQQLRQCDSGSVVQAIAYPTRKRETTTSLNSKPIKAVLAGLPRAEKGRDAIADLMSGLENELLKPGIIQMSMQMPAEGWQAMVPQSLHRSYDHAVSLQNAQQTITGPIEVMTENLTTEAYHRWLDSADLGLFLYDADRYVARCSGVVLEMMIRGVPVIVPDGCWLSEQVRSAGGHRSIGFIYQDRSEIPGLIRQFVKHRDAITERAANHAQTIAQRHDAVNTLRMMGLDRHPRIRAA